MAVLLISVLGLPLYILSLRNLLLPHVALTGPPVWTVPKALASIPTSTSSFRFTLPFF